MIALHDFNRLPEKEALARLHPCVAIPGWAEALVRGRPYSRREDVFSTALALTQRWDETALTQALSA
ncbi:2-oxo-4-hydroxy-4-carboxy-5-ureidoimidazoline decarboxylase, partial [Klebsiella pneumoniae]